ncbi:TetR/AcrR family transcriptional regulator [Agromyces albus]|uniref:TetR/AcrR family transcriptional regulator n=1 Tax=Agromyces albus TaxID=205332 RepID=A0A4Q2L436_9MICO|nr:TetR/AcrR family transcriptional regulator [Agromyces albus]RXZ71213.1 TetR/AcrR family transcriptional regulator [Agromyces albus]
MARTGRNYPKGLARREEILEVALRIVAERGYNAATIRELAEAVSLSKTGLLHHFGTKEELFAEILRRRDQRDIESVQSVGDARELLSQILAHNADVPGLVQLYSRFSAEASDPDHRAHEYFAERYERNRVDLATMVRALQEEGHVTPAADADALGALLLAAMDGLQLQWLYDKSFDMRRSISALMSALLEPRDAPEAEQGA